MSRIIKVLYKGTDTTGEDVLYGINQKQQFVALNRELKPFPGIPNNIQSEDAFCKDGDTLYMCTKCPGIQQILRFSLDPEIDPEPVGSDDIVPMLSHMIFVDGYICATTEQNIYVYDLEQDIRVVQPKTSSEIPSQGVFQGIAYYQGNLYFRKHDTVIRIPFQSGILYYSQATQTNKGPFALYLQVDSSVKYSNVKLTLPVEDTMDNTVDIGFDQTVVDTLLVDPVPYISLTDNLIRYFLTRSFSYTVPASYEDTILCGTICFLSGSMVLTDQGPVAIEYLVPQVHTIFRQVIQGISITYSLEDSLVCIAKHALSKFVPLRDTYLSNNHKIYYPCKDAFVEAGSLVGQRGIHRIPYENQLLYNVILEKPGIMNVNNLIAETLDPRNPISSEFIF